ncbi:hypothetical protein CEY16_05545 [Halalkalibacillus sediminis]|uniref:YqaJ viral recombinase domain-containing protein n=1 Tax=Halalkalibacillus sediminis TaxID=2018042 RepID=A0A2I0QXZ9_9BACI|nr:YqaJ viral recombinase family protein [Halalkalibacillus sediminis]PKR79205.1 hypothetical protein CEY16_05545 [Halalkalibacillus sediminis]
MSAEVLTVTEQLSREEWLKARQKGIGGSDAAAVAGLNRWKSPFQVFMEKVDKAPQEEIRNQEAMYWGNVMEDVVAKEFTERTGMKVRKRNAILKHPEYGWMLANVDRLIVGKKEGLECKTANEYAKQDWEGEEIPTAYLLQCQHYMAVTGYEVWWIAVLVGGNKFIYKRIERDQELINNLIEIEMEFWEQHVLKDEPPEIDGTEASESFLSSMYPESEPGHEVELPDAMDSYFDAIEVIKTEMKDLETRKKEYENKVKQMIGEAEKAYSSRHIVSWKSIQTNRFDSKSFKKDHPDLFKKYAKPSSYRRFTIKEAN